VVDDVFVTARVVVADRFRVSRFFAAGVWVTT
jgi:hypothetical protein